MNETRVAGMIAKESRPWSTKQLATMNKHGQFDFHHIVQRGKVWKKDRKSKLIDSMIIGYPVPSVWAIKRDAKDGEINGGKSNKVYVVLDGLQRLTTIFEYLNDEFSLSPLEPLSYEDENGDVNDIDISNMKFSELPDELKDIINNTYITINYFETLDDNGQREMFNRLNNGEKLSAKSKTLANCRDIIGIMDIGSHELFNQMLNNKQRENKNQVALVMKFWCMLNQDISNVSFDSKTFNPLVESTTVSEEEKCVMANVFDFAVEMHDKLLEYSKKVANKMYKETHLVSLAPFFADAIENGYSVDNMCKWLIEFFETEPIVKEDGKKKTPVSNSTLYNEASSNGTAKHSNIVGRHTALEDSYNKYFNGEEELEEDVDDDFDDDSEDIEEVEESETNESYDSDIRDYVDSLFDNGNVE